MDISLDLTQVIVVAITIILGWATKELTGLWSANKQKVKEQIKNDQLYKYIDLAGKTATDVVVALNQSIVKDLKAKSEDGKLTDEEIMGIKRTAISTIQSSLSDSTIEVLSTVYKDLPTVFQTWIDKAVLEAKEKNNINTISIPSTSFDNTITVTTVPLGQVISAETKDEAKG